MVCKAAAYLGLNERNRHWRNWNGAVAFEASEYFEPGHTLPGQSPSDGLAQLVHVVARATEEHQPLKAIGSGWALEDIAKSDSWVVCLKRLDRRIREVVDTALTQEWRSKQLQADGFERLVHVEAGIELGALSEMLETDGLAMSVLGGHNGQSLAGAISTSTHGGDWQQPPLPDLVKAIHLVTDGGRELWLERASDPITTDGPLHAALSCADVQIVRSDEIFNATLVSFGRFGVIYSLVLQVRKNFRLVEVVTNPKPSDVLQALRDGLAAGQPFGSLFALLSSTPPPAGLKEAEAQPGFFSSKPYFLQILFNSQDPDRCWVTRRWETIEAADLPSGNVSSSLTGAGVFLIANAAFSTAAALALTIPFAGLGYHARLLKAGIEMAARATQGRPTKGAALAAALTAAWALPFVGRAIPDITNKVLDSHFSGSTKNGRRGRHSFITSGAREESHTFDLIAESIEVVFAATDVRFCDFLDTILNTAPSFKQSGYVSLRPSRVSRAELSMHNVDGAHAVSIEISTAKDLPENAEWMAYVHDTALQHGGRPHWGQYNKLTQPGALALYGARLQSWREALYRVSKTSSIFSNNYTRQRGLEPLETADVKQNDVSYFLSLLLREPPPAVNVSVDVSYFVPLLLGPA